MYYDKKDLPAVARTTTLNEVCFIALAPLWLLAVNQKNNLFFYIKVLYHTWRVLYQRPDTVPLSFHVLRIKPNVLTSYNAFALITANKKETVRRCTSKILLALTQNFFRKNISALKARCSIFHLQVYWL